MTTKEQERKALAQIRKIVDGLGENSYIGTAFEGCFEIAEQNIENDWACSMKDRAESAEKKAAGLNDLVNDLGEKLQHAQGTIQYMQTNSRDSSLKAEEELKEARKHAMWYELYRELWMHFTSEQEKAQSWLLHYADLMASTDPSDIAFTQAVKSYKATKDSIRDFEWILTSLESIAPEEPKED